MGALCLSTRSHTIMKEAIYIDRPTYTGPTPEVHTNANYSCGNVGIGTVDPKQKLHVDCSLLVDTYEYGAGGTNGIFFRKDHMDYNLSILTYAHADTASADGLSINGYDGVSICTGSNQRNERMRIDLNGNVGIGTTNPGAYKLNVEGNTKVNGNLDVTGSLTVNGSNVGGGGGGGSLN